MIFNGALVDCMGPGPGKLYDGVGTNKPSGSPLALVWVVNGGN